VENQVSRQEAVSSDEVRQGEARQGLRQAPLYLWQDAGLETPQPRHRLLEADGREKAEEGTISLRSELVMRVTRGFKARRRRNRVLKLSKGYRGRRKNCYKRANQAVQRALDYASRDRARRKRDFRSLWIVRINAAARGSGISYSKLIAGLSKAKVALDRKI